jgi:fatty-acyl-CoA synthase
MMQAPLSTSYWPADTSEPVLDTTVGGVLREAAESAPDATALIAGAQDPEARRRWTYADLLADAETAARALLGRFSPGDRVAVWANNLPEWLVLEFGAGLAGMTLVTVNPAFKAKELAHVLTQSRAQGIFLLPEYRGNQMLAALQEVRPQLSELREVILLADFEEFCRSASPTERLPEVGPDDPAQIQYTSGTTGVPKGAVLRHRGITNNSRFFAQRLEGTSADVWMNPMPLFHTAGCVLVTLGSAQMRATQVLMPFFEPGLQLELTESLRATIWGGVPTMLIAVTEHADFKSRDLSSVRCAVAGGSTVPPHLVRRIESALGIPFSIGFGQTEASPFITQTRLDDAADDRAETLGRPYPQTEVRIVDPATQETAPTGTVGELCTRGYLVMKGYFDDPRATRQTIDEEGWLHTGDLCSMDERGYCRIEGRLKEMIIRGGENIYPREIEQLLFSHPTVGDVAVVGVPDPKWGEQVAAFIRPAPGQSPTQEVLFAFCREHLAPHKTPQHWVFVEGFPMTPSGKIQKFALREQFVTAQRARPT